MRYTLFAPSFTSADFSRCSTPRVSRGAQQRVSGMLNNFWRHADFSVATSTSVCGLGSSAWLTVDCTSGRPSARPCHSESVPGDEFPTAVYRSIVIAFAWMMVVAWLAFGRTSGTDLDLAAATVLFVVFLALPIIMYRTTANRVGHEPQLAAQRFWSSRVDIATGTLSRREAWLEVLMIPIALALAATFIGGAWFLS
jgi:hypothetical protein